MFASTTTSTYGIGRAQRHLSSRCFRQGGAEPRVTQRAPANEWRARKSHRRQPARTPARPPAHPTGPQVPLRPRPHPGHPPGPPQPRPRRSTDTKLVDGRTPTSLASRKHRSRWASSHDGHEAFQPLDVLHHPLGCQNLQLGLQKLRKRNFTCAQTADLAQTRCGVWPNESTNGNCAPKRKANLNNVKDRWTR